MTFNTFKTKLVTSTILALVLLCFFLFTISYRNKLIKIGYKYQSLTSLERLSRY